MIFFGDVKINNSSECRSVSFSPIATHLLAICLYDGTTQNGTILIYDTEKREVAKTYIVPQSHILCIEWHQQYEDIFASGSTENIVRIYDLKNVSGTVLNVSNIVFILTGLYNKTLLSYRLR